MSEITRRSFLKQSGATAAAAGAVIATPKVLRGSASKGAKTAKTAMATGATHTTAGPARPAKATRALVVHVPDTRKDEVRLLVADREVILHDRDLVSRLSRAAD